MDFLFLLLYIIIFKKNFLFFRLMIIKTLTMMCASVPLCRSLRIVEKRESEDLWGTSIQETGMIINGLLDN